MTDLKSILKRKSKTSCKSCNQSAPCNQPTPKKTPITKAQILQKQMPKIPSATCPRCGTHYDIQHPELVCKVCSLKLGVLNKEENEIEWNKRMQEPYPDFLNFPLQPIEVFQKTIEWYYKKWIKPKKGNPSYRVP